MKLKFSNYNSIIVTLSLSKQGILSVLSTAQRAFHEKRRRTLFVCQNMLSSLEFGMDT